MTTVRLKSSRIFSIASILLLLLVMKASPVFALQIKRVQSVQAVLEEDQLHADAFLDNRVDVEKAFIIISSETVEIHAEQRFNQVKEKGGEGPAMVTAHFETETTIRFSRLRSDEAAEVAVKAQAYIIEFKDDVRVQRGVARFNRDVYEKDLQVQSIDTNASFPILSVRSDNWFADETETMTFTAKFPDPSTLKIQRDDVPEGDRETRPAIVDVEWQIVEFLSGAHVSSGEVKIAHYLDSKNVYLLDANMTDSENGFFIHHYAAAEGTNGVEGLIKTRMMLEEDNKTLTFSRMTKGNRRADQVNTVWYAIEMDNPSTYVQRGRTVLEEEEFSKTLKIGAVDKDRAFPQVFASAGLPKDAKDSDQLIHHSMIRAELTDSESLTLSRFNGDDVDGITAYIDWFVIEFAPITLIAPNGGEVMKVGEAYPIEWEYSTIAEKNGSGLREEHLIDIYLSLNGGKDAYPYLIKSGIPVTDKQYMWTVPEFIDEGNMIGFQTRIKIMDTDLDERNWDTSDGNFAIKGSIRLLSPFGGEVWRVGDFDRKIKWAYQGGLKTVAIYYDTTSGYNEPAFHEDNLIAYNIPHGNKGIGTYDWEGIPDIYSHQMRLKIVQESDPTVYDISANDFTILPVIKIESPNTETRSWLAQTEKEISWSTLGTIEKFNLYYSTDQGQTWTPIGLRKNVEKVKDMEAYSYPWFIPSEAVGENALVLVQMTKEKEVYDYFPKGEEIFSIIPWIQITSPNHGYEIFKIGETRAITWEINGEVDHVQVEHSFDGGDTWQKDAILPADKGVYNWEIPNAMTNKGLIRLTDMADTTHREISDNPFRVEGIITLTYPNGDEKFRGGSDQPITWIKADGMGDVTLMYSTDGGRTYPPSNILGRNISGNSFKWTIPEDMISYQVKIKVMLEQGNMNYYDESDKDFIIEYPSNN